VRELAHRFGNPWSMSCAAVPHAIVLLSIAARPAGFKTLWAKEISERYAPHLRAPPK
jgi:hypothetical protein